MTRDAALALSGDLARAGFSHTIQVGIHDRFNPPEQYRVDLVSRSGGYGVHDLQDLADIAERNGVTLRWGGLIHEGVTFESAEVAA